MQTLVSCFDDRAKARRTFERLEAMGFAREDLHLQDAPAKAATRMDKAPTRGAGQSDERELDDKAMHSVEHEVAVGPDVFESLGRFFSSLFGRDTAKRQSYEKAVKGGHTMLIVEAHTDHEAEQAALVLHEGGCVNVHDEVSADDAARPGVHRMDRTSQPPLRELVAMSQYEGANHS